MTEKNKSDDLTINQFAKALKVSYWVAYGWVASGKVKGKKKGPFPGKTSPIFISMSELERVRKLMDSESSGNGQSDQS